MIAHENDLITKEACDKCHDNMAKELDKLSTKIDNLQGSVNSVSTKVAVLTEKIAVNKTDTDKLEKLVTKALWTSVVGILGLLVNIIAFFLSKYF